jgi:putative Mn2+ efflux pump MntP
MPVLGWLSGLTFRERVSGVDHWLSFGLLAVIGGKMIFESFKIENMEDAKPQMTGVVLLGLAVATSIDAFVVGIGFSFLKVSILLPVAVIGIVTFFMSFAGVFLGSKLGDIMGKKVEFLGGLILLIIGLKILLQHLYAAY